jgi:hypothetical protein
MALQKFRFTYKNFTYIMSFEDLEEGHRDITKPKHITQEKKEGNLPDWCLEMCNCLPYGLSLIMFMPRNMGQ